MLILISPAKTLDYQSPLTTTRYTLPELLDNAQQLIHEARKLTPPQISSLMRISDKLAGLKVMSTLACRPKPSAKTISILPNSICECFPACMAYCARSI